MTYKIVRLSDAPEMKARMAAWFHEKWRIPLEAYLESMDECLASDGAYPEWYAAVDGERIIGGAGVIENDFHELYIIQKHEYEAEKKARREEMLKQTEEKDAKL